MLLDFLDCVVREISSLSGVKRACGFSAMVFHVTVNRSSTRTLILKSHLQQYPLCDFLADYGSLGAPKASERGA